MQGGRDARSVYSLGGEARCTATQPPRWPMLSGRPQLGPCMARRPACRLAAFTACSPSRLRTRPEGGVGTKGGARLVWPAAAGGGLAQPWCRPPPPPLPLGSVRRAQHEPLLAQPWCRWGGGHPYHHDTYFVVGGVTRAAGPAPGPSPQEAPLPCRLLPSPSAAQATARTAQVGRARGAGHRSALALTPSHPASGQHPRGALSPRSSN